jgi:hypothetical protein
MKFYTYTMSLQSATRLVYLVYTLTNKNMAVINIRKVSDTFHVLLFCYVSTLIAYEKLCNLYSSHNVIIVLVLR